MADKGLVRAFLAIDLPDRLRGEIGKIQDRLRPHVSGIRWTRPEGIHLTLKFFGDISEDEIEILSRVIENTTGGVSSFSLRLGTPGAFPGTRRPRVLWIGVDGDVAALVKLQQDIERDLETGGFRMESRPYSPHLTMGRFRDPVKSSGLERTLENIKDVYQAESFLAEGLTLFKSDLKPGGAVYKVLKFFPFGKNKH
jgi:RNA 2',3'-cyclic 3'-phosphodiesterase